MTLPDMLRRWLREPLLHFLLAGLAIFLWSAWRGTEVDPASRTITIDAPHVERLAQAWTQTWQRPPNQREIDGLIRDYVREEIYYREALRLGLDKDDTVIRRRLMAKMEVLAAAEAANVEPTEAQLQRWLDGHRARFAPDTLTSFDQVYVAASDEVAARSRANALLGRLQGGADWRGLGDTISVPGSMEAADSRAIVRLFGDDFAGALAGLQQGRWAGPVVSGYGLHLVRVRQVSAAGPVALADVRPQVEEDWRKAMVARRTEQAYQALLAQYDIRITPP